MPAKYHYPVDFLSLRRLNRVWRLFIGFLLFFTIIDRGSTRWRATYTPRLRRRKILPRRMRGRNGMGVTIPVNRMAPRRIQRRTSATPDSVRGRVESRLNLHSPFSAHQSIHLQVIDPIVRMRSVVCVPRLVDLIQIKADSLTTTISRWKKGRRVPSAMEVSQPCSNITTKHPIA